MADTLQPLDTAPLLFLAGYVIIAIASLVALWRLARQWHTHDVAARQRWREALLLGLAVLVAVALVALAQEQSQRQARAQRLQAELQERDRIAALLRTRIGKELDSVRAMLAERTVRHIEADTLADARRELARFAELRDPRITQMLALIDTELEIRALVAQSLVESAPQALARIYARLAELEPSNPQYHDKAAQFAARAASRTP